MWFEAMQASPRAHRIVTDRKFDLSWALEAVRGQGVLLLSTRETAFESLVHRITVRSALADAQSIPMTNSTDIHLTTYFTLMNNLLIFH